MTAMRVKKQYLVRLVAAGLAAETYEHRYQDQVRIYNVTAMRAMVATLALPPIEVPLSDLLPHLRTNCDWEEERVASLDEFSWRQDPCLAVVEEDPERGPVHTFIDGIHRVFRREREGLTTALLYIVPIEQAIFVNQEVYKALTPFSWGQKDFQGDTLVPVNKP